MKFTFPPETRPLDGFTIKRAIYRGGFGEVYYALSDAGKEVALKLLQQNLDVELRGVSQCLNLKHPNLVTIFDIRSDADGDHWVVMEYVSGPNLEKVIAAHPEGMPVDDVRHWLEGMTRGVAFLHDRGIVHRDIKPANVLSEAGVIKVGDVGLSKFMTVSRRSAHTQSVGTVYYMAPEVAHGRYGREVDVYSLGIILYEMLTGSVPFTGETAGEILMKHLTEQPDLSVLSPELQPVLAGALQKNPAERTPTLEQLFREFDAAITRTGEAALNPLATSRSELPPQSEPLRKTRLLDDEPPPNSSARNETAGTARSAATQNPGEKPWHQSAGEFCRRNWFIIVPLLLLVMVRRGFGGWTGLTFFLILGVAILSATKAVDWLLHWRPGVGPDGHRHHNQHGRPQRGDHGGPPEPSTSHRSTFWSELRSGKCMIPQSTSWGFWEHATELVASLLKALTAAIVLTAGLVLLSNGMFRGGVPSGSDDWGAISLFLLTAVLGSWALLVQSRLQDAWRADPIVRRATGLVLGTVLGLFAWGIDSFLLVDLPMVIADKPGGMFAHIGRFELTDVNNQPTLASYIVFFAGLFAVRRWWRQSDVRRRSRFRLSSVLVTVFTAYMLAIVWYFPLVWGLTWGATLSCLVQVASSSRSSLEHQAARHGHVTPPHRERAC